MSPAIEKLCSSCKGPSPTRKYCDQCVSDLSISARENPAHEKSARDEGDTSLAAREGAAREELRKYRPPAALRFGLIHLHIFETRVDSLSKKSRLFGQ